MTHDFPPDAAMDACFDHAADEGCPDSRLLISRRGLMGLSAGLFTWASAPRISSAAGASDPRLLIVLLRGGIDGLNVLPFYDDGSYSPKSRGSLYLEKDEQLALAGNSGFRLNGVLKNVQAMYDAGNVRIVLPVAPPLQTRSHFDCSYNLENGLERSARSDSGWLNRLFASLPADSKALLKYRPLQIGNTPVILTGSEPVYSWSPWIYQPDFFRTSAAASLRSVYGRLSPELARKIDDGMALDRSAAGLPEDRAISNALQRSFIGAARLLATADGPRIAVLTVDNFDAHVREEANTNRVLANLDTSLGLFRDRAQSLGIWDKTLVVCVSEFGRTVGDNGKGGSDHGIGTTAILAGGAISRSDIIGQWPNLLNRSALGENNDIPALYDTRDLFKAVLREHLGIDDSATRAQIINTAIFPGVDNLPRGIIPLRNLLG